MTVESAARIVKGRACGVRRRISCALMDEKGVIGDSTNTPTGNLVLVQTSI